MSRRLVAGAALLLLVRAGTAGAHAFLDHAEPRVGATVTTPPVAVTLVFTEAVEPAFSRVELTDDQGGAVSAKPLEHPKDDTIVVPVPALAPGSYTVHWTVVSVDTHATEGRFQFVVKAP